MSLISIHSISKIFGARPLFDGLSFTISEGDRIGLLGPNGAGKSTLVRILAGLMQPDSGTVAFRKGLRLAYVEQEPAFDGDVTVQQVLRNALLERPIPGDHDEDAESRINVTLGKVGFKDFDASGSTLSGGWRKRLAIARELVVEPDVLLLDEPTNHLDLDGIVWLERLLASSRFACVAVSHDRYFLENVSNSVAEINRVYPEGIFRARGSYSEFLLKREEFLAAQQKHREGLENKVKREVEWLRRGPKARTGKSKARIDSAGRLIEELGEARSRAVTGTARIDFSASGRQSKRLLSGEGIAKSLGGKMLFHGVNLTLTPGTRLGLVGVNGSGKTTLLRIIEGSLEPDAGQIERADNLRIVYFDQHRQELEPEVSLRRALCPHGDSVIYRDRPLHVASWAERFLFSKEQLDVAVGRLSGGERARVAIARLMLQPADLLLLDEPTNDLDIPTLEVLEDSLKDFAGALVLVTHDRYLLDAVSTIVLAIDNQAATAYADYSQWEQARAARSESQPAVRTPAGKEAQPEAVRGPAQGRKRLSYMESREWETIEERIRSAEANLNDLNAQLHSSEVMRDPKRLADVYARTEAAKAEVDALFERWAELESKQQAAESKG